ncbi:uncharacterized protein [Haliotis asinina]|uniref:uncharacterized protein n=1 Tax=Haliotis asinina TaxID=109174 RepID=UPI003531B990
MACCTHCVKETLIVCFVVCSVHCGYTTTHEKYIYLNNSRLNWWDARANCQINGGDLFVPVTEPQPSRQSGTRNRSTYYWLGAMKYSTWIWTEDGSPLYRNSRPSTLPDDMEASITFPNNSVYTCHRHCGRNTHTLGLSRDRCFCLDDEYDVSSSNSGDCEGGEPCPGNPDEVCGDANRMSVYNRHLASIPTEIGRCGYAVKDDNSLTISLDNNCRTNRKYACYEGTATGWSCYPCRGKVCVSCWKRTWAGANDRCKLVKLNSSSVEDLKGVMSRDTKYWIGLVYTSNRKWITGHEVSAYDEGTSSEPHCLAMSFMTWYAPQLSWKSCSVQYASICEVVRPKTSTTTTTTTATVTTTMTPQPSPATATTASETPTHQPTGNVPTFTDKSEVGRSEPVIASNGTQTGVSIGLGCVVLILIVIILILLLMRQNKLCFKRKSNEQSVHFNTATQNTTSDLEVPAQTTTAAYTDIEIAYMSDVKPMSSAVPMAAVRPRIQNYDNTFHSDGDENNYSVLSQPGKHQAPVTHGKPINNLPEHDKGDYDTAQAWGQGAGSTGLNNSEPSAVTRAPRISQDDNDVVGQHDPGGTAEMYDHFRDGERQGKTPREVDDSYSHIGRTNKGFDKNAYDVASTRQTEDRRDDTYNHTDSVKGNPGDNNDYYNTKCLFRDNNESLGRQHDIQDNGAVYTLAKRVSDA